MPNRRSLGQIARITTWRIEVIKLWIDVVAGLVLLFGIYAFVELTGARTRWMTRRTERTAESMYDNYADSRRQQRRSAKRRASTSQDGSSPRRPEDR